MRILVASDKFKGSMTSTEATESIASGVLDVLPDAEVLKCPLADGGEGTVEVSARALDAEVRKSTVTGPLPGMKVEATWAFAERLPFGTVRLKDLSGRDVLVKDRPTAIIEMAQASGLVILKGREMRVMEAMTYGTGELIAEALDAGAEQVIVGLGGSATVDGGTGMAAALGYRFLDERGDEVSPCGGNLLRIKRIDAVDRDMRIQKVRFFAACDVENPLVGPEGAARVYAPQKGAGKEEVELLEEGLSNLGKIMRDDLGVDAIGARGAGAAGGLGAGLMAFCGASAVRGFELVAAFSGLREIASRADLILTGEGSFDEQTLYGKAPSGVIRVAEERDVPIIVIAGRLRDFQFERLGRKVAVYSVCPGPVTEDESMLKAEEFVRKGTARLMRILLVAGAF